ncbi:MAG: hypothetical protein QOI57_171 [Rubrobacteraceae bacterium]|nr:hypothetical protein [Rubrobacteraceae bacterium]
MQVGLIMWGPASGITMLARIAFGLVILGMAVPVVARRWSCLTKTIGTDAESGESLNLDALWELYKRGEISWDEYLRGKIEGRRGLIGVEGARGLCRTKEKPSSNTTSSIVSGS